MTKVFSYDILSLWRPYGETPAWSGRLAASRKRVSGILTSEEEEESRYGVKFNSPQTGLITMPDGSITDMDWWRELTSQQKADITTGGVTVNKQLGIVTLPGGKAYTQKAWGQMTSEKQLGLIKGSQPPIDSNRVEQYDRTGK